MTRDPGMAAPAVRVRGLGKEYRFRPVLEGISFEVRRGEFLALFGANGAGKTTLLRIIAGISRPDGGTVEIGGAPLRGPRAVALRQTVGFLSHQTLLYDGLTGLENLVFFGRLYGVPRPGERAERLLREIRLWERRNDPAGEYSRGMQQRLAIARALVHDPEILLLDEPFTGLDPVATAVLGEILKTLRERGRTAIIALHDLEMGLGLSDRWALLAGGRLAAEGASRTTTPEALAALYLENAGGAPVVSRRNEVPRGLHA